jgi:hypothetical protein
MAVVVDTDHWGPSDGDEPTEEPKGKGKGKGNEPTEEPQGKGKGDYEPTEMPNGKGKGDSPLEELQKSENCPLTLLEARLAILEKAHANQAIQLTTLSSQGKGSMPMGSPPGAHQWSDNLYNANVKGHPAPWSTWQHNTPVPSTYAHWPPMMHQ